MAPKLKHNLHNSVTGERSSISSITASRIRHNSAMLGSTRRGYHHRSSFPFCREDSPTRRISTWRIPVNTPAKHKHRFFEASSTSALKRRPIHEYLNGPRFMCLRPSPSCISIPKNPRCVRHPNGPQTMSQVPDPAVPYCESVRFV